MQQQTSRLAEEGTLTDWLVVLVTAVQLFDKISECLSRGLSYNCQHILCVQHILITELGITGSYESIFITRGWQDILTVCNVDSSPVNEEFCNLLQLRAENMGSSVNSFHCEGHYCYIILGAQVQSWAQPLECSVSHISSTSINSQLSVQSRGV